MNIHLFKFLFILFSLFCFSASIASAEPEVRPPNNIISRVIVKTPTTSQYNEASDYILAHISAKSDSIFSQIALANDQRVLLDSGLFSDVRIFIENTAIGRVDVIFDVKMAPRFRAPLRVSGNDYFSSNRIRKELNLENGDRINQARLNAACDKLREAYRKSYFNNVSVQASVSPADDEGFASVSITIQEGAREKLLNFEFSGNTALSSASLRSILGRPSPFNPFRIFYSQWRMDAFDHSLVRDRIVTAYRNLGFLDVSVSDPVLSRKSPTSRPIMHISISEGSRYTIAGASFDGINLFPESEIRRVASYTAKPGTPASDASLRATEKAIRDYYGARGYVDTSVSVRTIPLRNSSATSPADIQTTLQINVKEGFLAHIRSVSIRGNTFTKDKVIRRELAVAPGMIMNEVLAETSRRRIENLGYFENVRIRETPSPDDPTLRDVTFDVTEKSTGTLMAGIGTSNIDNILGYIDISQNNFDILNWPTFRGAGQKIRITASAGSSSNSGEISWTDPWFLDKKQSFTASVYRREHNFSEYDETRIGGDLSLAVPLKYGRITAKIGVESLANDEFISSLYHPEDDPNADFFFSEQMDDRYLRIPLRLTWSYDTRNHPFVPSRGSRNNVFAEIQSSSLGSEYDLYKLGFDLRQYVPTFIFDHYLSLRLRAESVESFGDTEEVPINDRYFLGGARSIRGFRYREVGPKVLPDAKTGGRAHPVGGLSLAAATAEYNIPVASVFRIAAFYDIGNVWANAFDFNFSEYASSWGVGVRFDIPGFPIRLDYAFPLEHDDESTRTESFIFSIGFE